MNYSGKITVTADVKNTGSVAGEETVQLYIRDVTASVVRPVKELMGFKKVVLQPGQQETVSFEIDEHLLRFYNIENKFVSEPGKFEVFVGDCSYGDKLLHGEFRLTK